MSFKVIQNNNPYSWFSTTNDFLLLAKPAWLTSLQEHHQRCMNCPADESQKAAWEHSFDILQVDKREIVSLK